MRLVIFHVRFFFFLTTEVRKKSWSSSRYIKPATGRQRQWHSQQRKMISPASWFYYGKDKFEDICLEFLTLTYPEFKAYLNLVWCGFCPGQGRLEPLLIILRVVRVSWTGPNSSCSGLGEGQSWVFMNLLLSSFSSTLKGTVEWFCYLTRMLPGCLWPMTKIQNMLERLLLQH